MVLTMREQRAIYAKLPTLKSSRVKYLAVGLRSTATPIAFYALYSYIKDSCYEEAIELLVKAKATDQYQLNTKSQFGTWVLDSSNSLIFLVLIEED